MLKDVLEKELQETEFSWEDYEELTEELAGCGAGSTKDTGHCSGSCGTVAKPFGE